VLFIEVSNYTKINFNGVYEKFLVIRMENGVIEPQWAQLYSQILNTDWLRDLIPMVPEDVWLEATRYRNTNKLQTYIRMEKGQYYRKVPAEYRCCRITQQCDVAQQKCTLFVTAPVCFESDTFQLREVLMAWKEKHHVIVTFA